MSPRAPTQLKIRPGDEKLSYALKQTTVNGKTSYVHEAPTRFKLVARECQKVTTCEAAEDEGNVVQQGACPSMKRPLLETRRQQDTRLFDV